MAWKTFAKHISNKWNIIHIIYFTSLKHKIAVINDYFGSCLITGVYFSHKVVYGAIAGILHTAVFITGVMQTFRSCRQVLWSITKVVPEEEYGLSGTVIIYTLNDHSWIASKIIITMHEIKCMVFNIFNFVNFLNSIN